MAFAPVPLGRTGLQVSRIGLSSGYGIAGADVERAFERGINYLYWGSRRTATFGRAVKHLARRHRDDMVVVVQSYSRSKLALGPSVDSALGKLDIEYADILLLGWWNHEVPARILDKALELREAGKVRHLMISCHHRPTFRDFINNPCYGAIMVRYNAAHRGAETEVFPAIAEHPNPPGVVAYTATRWGALLNPAYAPEGCPAVQAADCYRFALSNPHVSMCLTGPKNSAQLDGALAALDGGPMDPDEMAWIQRVGDSVHGVSQKTIVAHGVKRTGARLWNRLRGRGGESQGGE
jgi:aryl-alcohol dehydrogenase-like predicted oxidoreductase